MLRARPAFATEPPPPLGERNRKLIEDGCIVQPREERLLDIWCRKLRDELLLINAPVLASLQGSLDPDRAALLLTGSTRASTLKRYLGYYRQWRLWLGEAKLRQPPGRPTDLVDYLRARRDEPCGRSTPKAILKAIAWVERVASSKRRYVPPTGLGPLRTRSRRSCRKGHVSPSGPRAILSLC